MVTLPLTVKHILILSLCGFTIAIVLTPLVIYFCKKTKILDYPNEKRKIHKKPIPQLGGIVIFVSYVITLLVAYNLNKYFNNYFSFYLPTYITGLIIFFLIGLIDDLKDLRPIQKLSFQIIGVLIIYIKGIRIDVVTFPFFGSVCLPNWLGLIFTAIWILSVINSINLIDGLDGLASGISLIASLTVFFSTIIIKDLTSIFTQIIYTSIIFGFLIYNFHPAKIFLGDSGTSVIGYIFAVNALIGIQKVTTATALLVPIMVLIIPAYDTLMAIIRRAKLKEHPFSADKKHLHHRLHQLGLSHKEVVVFFYFICIYFGLMGFTLSLIPSQFSILIIIIMFMTMFIGAKTLLYIEKLRKD